ncbi:MAG: hypothetical protein CM15mV52_0730 [uncultured marine virus]|nr:MAG: hypothetical protein CM15mV52_0730 [uncultured marine virus]
MQDNNASSNVGIGHQAGQNVTTGGNSVYIGDNAGRTITDAGSNVMIGYQAGYPLGSSASSNVIVGSNAAVSATASTNDSVIIGQEAGYSTGGKQIAIGKRALYFPEGNFNVAIGQSLCMVHHLLQQQNIT